MASIVTSGLCTVVLLYKLSMRSDQRIHNPSSRSSMKGDCPLTNFQLAVVASQINNGVFIAAGYRHHA